MSLVILTACAPVTPVVSPAPGSVEPPPATLEINGQTQTAGIGSYCWSGSQGQQTCADMAGVPTAHDPLVTGTPFVGHFHLPLTDPPESLYVTVMAVVPYNDLTGGAGETRLWQITSGWSSELPLKSEVDYEFMDSPSLYVIQLDARWKDRGDVTYGFLVQVGPVDNGLGLPTTTPGTPFSTVTPLSLQILSPLTRLGKGTVSTLAVSPDGNWLAIATPLGVYMYETATQNEAWYRQFTSKPTVLTFSPDSLRLAVGLASSILPVVDTRTGQTVMELTGEEGIHGVWSPDGKAILTSGQCEQVLVWDAESGEIAHEVQPVKCNNVTPGYVNAVWSSDGRRIYIATGSNILAWDTSTYQPVTGFQPDLPEFIVGYVLIPSPAGNLLAVGNGLTVAILDGGTGASKKTFAIENQTVSLWNIAWSQDGRELAVGNYYKQSIWDVESGELLTTIDLFTGLAWMPDGDTLVGTPIEDNGVEAVSMTSGKVLFSLAGFGHVNVEGGAPFWDGDTLLTFDGFDEIRWNPRTGDIAEQHTAANPDWLSEYWRPPSPDGTRFATGTMVMDAKTGAELVRLADDSDEMRDVVAWSPDGSRIVSGASLGLAPTVVWDARTGKVLLTLPLEADGDPFLGALAWSPDGAWVTAGGSLDPGGGSDNGMIVLWDAPTGKQTHLLTASMHSERIQSIAWSPAGRWLAAGMYSGRIVLWDMHLYVPIASLNGHIDTVMSLSWSADSRMLASSSLDGTVLTWEVP